jgi:prepilin-type N-terminal cleavage/methylation domain-containing protein
MQSSSLNSKKKSSYFSTILVSSSLAPCTSSKTNKHHKNRGFTIVELLVTIAVAGIIITIALPSMGDFIAKMRVDNEISQLNRLVLTARNSAISMEQDVIVCPLVNNACTTNWNNEISVFIDEDGNGAFNDDDRLLKVKAATTAGDSITYAGQNNITFAPTGTLASVASSFVYCPSSDNTLGRAVVFSISGRSYLTSDTNGDGRDQDRTGTNVACP